MEFLIDHPWPLGLMAAILFACAIEAGYLTATRFRIQENAHRKDQMVAIRDGLFVLVSLLLGFTLALSAQRFGDRRSLLIDEANAIGTTYLRADTLPATSRDEAQQLLRQYVDARLDFDNAGLDETHAIGATDHAKEIQERLWKNVAEVTRNDRSAVTAAYMSSLNQTIDLHEKRLSSSENRIPRPVWFLIFCCSTITIFTRGLTLAGRFWLTLVLAPLTIAIVIALIADLDTPGSGMIRLDQRAMQRLRADISKHQ